MTGLQLCLNFQSVVRQRGYCPSSDGCVPGCSSPQQACRAGFYWRDEETCVAVRDCTCRSAQGGVVAPGSVVQESDCEVCQCLDNEYLCDSDTCDDGDANRRKYRTSTKRPRVTGDEFTDVDELTTVEDQYRRNLTAQSTTTRPPLVYTTLWSTFEKRTTVDERVHRNVSVVTERSQTSTTESDDYDYDDDDERRRSRTPSTKTTRGSGGEVTDVDELTTVEDQYRRNLTWSTTSAPTMMKTTRRTGGEVTDVDELTTVEDQYQRNLTLSTKKPRPTGPATVAAACAYWSDWINENDAEGGAKGDREMKTAQELRDAGFCPAGTVSDIECRDAGRDRLYTETGDRDVVCSLDAGLTCLPSRQGQWLLLSAPSYWSFQAPRFIGSFIGWNRQGRSVLRLQDPLLLPVPGTNQEHRRGRHHDDDDDDDDDDRSDLDDGAGAATGVRRIRTGVAAGRRVAGAGLGLQRHQQRQRLPQSVQRPPLRWSEGLVQLGGRQRRTRTVHPGRPRRRSVRLRSGPGRQRPRQRVRHQCLRAVQHRPSALLVRQRLHRRAPVVPRTAGAFRHAAHRLPLTSRGPIRQTGTANLEDVHSPQV